MPRYLFPLAFILVASFCSTVPAEDSTLPTLLDPDAVRNAIQKAIPRLEQGATGSAAERKCYTCHSQGLPVFALAEAEKRGCEIDRNVLQQQLEHTWNHLARGKGGYLAGKGQGGQVMTAGYALWTLEAGDWKADETTTAVTHYLIEYQRDKDHWTLSSKRPPSSGSGFTATYLALRGLSYFGNESQREEIKARQQEVAKWILESEPKDTEDRVFQLRAFPYIGADRDAIRSAVDGLLAIQDSHGGWAQTKDMQPDAYATGSVLTALQEVGGLPGSHAAIVSGCQYLIDSQLPDGSWHVVTRADPIQDYFESGFPHGEDQFISIAATGWAVLALAHTLP